MNFTVMMFCKKGKDRDALSVKFLSCKSLNLKETQRGHSLCYHRYVGYTPLYSFDF